MPKATENRRRIAAELLKVAKQVLAAGDYRYDPDHKHKPQGGGWEPTDKGWTKRKRQEGQGGNGGNESEDYQARRSRAFGADTPAKELERLSHDPNDNVRTGVACNKNTHPTTLTKLSRDPAIGVRCAVGENPKTPSKILTRLAQDESSDIRMGVASNTATPRPILAHLATDSDSGVRLCVAENPSAGLPERNHLIRDPDNYVRSAALLNYPANYKVEFTGKADGKRVTLVKTDKERTIKTDRGDFTASPGDWVEITADGKFGAPRKPDVVFTDYR